MDSKEREVMMASIRHMLHALPDSELLEYFEKTVVLEAVRPIGIMTGLIPEDKAMEQQYRMSIYSTKQEILRRMANK